MAILKGLGKILQADATSYKTFLLDIAGTSLSTPDAMQKVSKQLMNSLSLSVSLEL